jgi:hypothetical protein
MNDEAPFVKRGRFLVDRMGRMAIMDCNGEQTKLLHDVCPVNQKVGQSKIIVKSPMQK